MEKIKHQTNVARISMNDSSQRSFICYPNQRLVVVSLHLLNVYLDCSWRFPSFEFFYLSRNVQLRGLFNSTLQSLCLVVHYVLRQYVGREKGLDIEPKCCCTPWKIYNCLHHLHILCQAEN